MPDADCTQLDDYLDGDLDAAARRAFEAHLRACDACRQSAAFAQHTEQLLATARPVAPAGLVERIDRRLRRERALQISQRCGLLAAAAVLIALGIWSSRGRVQDVVPVARPSQQVAVAPERDVQIRFGEDERVIAMPLKTKNPQVTIVWVYPEVRRVAANDALDVEPQAN